MKINENEPIEPVGFSSSDSVIIIEDRPGENPIHPLDPRLQKLLEAEREKIRRWRSHPDNLPKDEAAE